MRSFLTSTTCRAAAAAFLTLAAAGAAALEPVGPVMATYPAHNTHEVPLNTKLWLVHEADLPLSYVGLDDESVEVTWVQWTAPETSPVMNTFTSAHQLRIGTPEALEPFTDYGWIATGDGEDHEAPEAALVTSSEGRMFTPRTRVAQDGVLLLAFSAPVPEGALLENTAAEELYLGGAVGALELRDPDLIETVHVGVVDAAGNFSGTTPVDFGGGGCAQSSGAWVGAAVLLLGLARRSRQRVA